MCDTSPLEGCFKSLVEREMHSLEDTISDDTQTAIIFPPLPPKLRFFLHNTLQTHPAFRTVSVGVDPDRSPILFKPRGRVSIMHDRDIPEGRTFDGPEEEFNFRTGLTDVTFTKPTHDFDIFLKTEIDHLPADFSKNYPFVSVSLSTKYITIRRALCAYYKKGFVNCYEIRGAEAGQSDHIIITNNRLTTSEISASHREELNLVKMKDVGGVVGHTLEVMARCGKLVPAKPRAVVNRSAAANIMSRHLGIAKSANKSDAFDP